MRRSRGSIRPHKALTHKKIMTTTRKKVRKAVLPVAGLGTRFLPATKAMPKEMLPVVDKPLIQYAVEECIASGIEHVIFVTGRRKNAIEDHFDFAPELESFLESKGKSQQAQMVREISGGMHFSYTRQNEALGLGHAVLTAQELVGDEPFAVLLGDVIMDGPVAATRSLIEIYNETGKGAITVQEVEPEELQFYGVIDAEKAPGSRWRSAAEGQQSGGETENRDGAFQSGGLGALRAAAGNF